MTVWLDKPLELELFKWPERKPEEVRAPEAEVVVLAPPPAEFEADTKTIEVPEGAFFPHEIPSEHWNVDFGDSKQVYEGADLPVWLLAGWAAFILWAVIYLIFGLPTAF